jgi:hypothetical protein
LEMDKDELNKVFREDIEKMKELLKKKTIK